MEKRGYKTERKHGKKWEAVDWAGNASMYEINIRQYTPEGTFMLLYLIYRSLKELGINILWFMPDYCLFLEKIKRGLWEVIMRFRTIGK